MEIENTAPITNPASSANVILHLHLTKREWLAGMALSGLCVTAADQHIAGVAVQIADEIIQQLATK